MNNLSANLVLSFVWAMVTGSFSGANLLIGYLIGMAVLRVSSAVVPRYHRKTQKAIGFFVFYLRQLFASNIKVAYDVLTPRLRMRPGVVAIPLAAQTDAEITLLSNLITLTPGTLSLDLSPDRRTLFVHVMYLQDIDAFRRSIKDGLERRVLELLR